MAAVAMLGSGIVPMVVLIGLLAMVLVAMADITNLSYTPAAFLGAAAYFGAGAKLDHTIVFVIATWIAGVAFGYLSEFGALRLKRPD